MDGQEIIEKLEKYFGADRLPDPLNYPNSFKYYVRMYNYLKET